MNPEERERRKQNYKALADLLALLTGNNRDEYEAYRYSELIAEAIVELTTEQKRIQRDTSTQVNDH